MRQLGCKHTIKIPVHCDHQDAESTTTTSFDSKTVFLFLPGKIFLKKVLRLQPWIPGSLHQLNIRLRHHTYCNCKSMMINVKVFLE